MVSDLASGCPDHWDEPCMATTIYARQSANHTVALATTNTNT